jgi:hypothetical protein
MTLTSTPSGHERRRRLRQGEGGALQQGDRLAMPRPVVHRRGREVAACDVRWRACAAAAAARADAAAGLPLRPRLSRPPRRDRGC